MSLSDIQSMKALKIAKQNATNITNINNTFGGGSVVNIFDINKVQNNLQYTTSTTISSPITNVEYKITQIFDCQPGDSFTANKSVNWSQFALWGFNADGTFNGYINFNQNSDGSYTAAIPTTGNQSNIRKFSINIRLGSDGLLDQFMLIKGTTLASKYIATRTTKPSTFLDYGVKELIVSKNNMEDTLKQNLKVGSLSFNFPPAFVAICGEKAEFYNYGCCDTYMNPQDYKLDWWNSTIYDDFGKFGIDATAISTPSTISSKITVYDKQHNTVLYDGNNYTFRIIPVPANPASDKNILFIGDSLIAGAVFTQSFIDRVQTTFGLTNYKLVGRVVQSTTNKYEAQGGFSWNNYTDNPATLTAPYNFNRFWNPNINDIDINYYMTTYCGGANLDYMIINLGWNHLVNSVYSSDINTITTLAKKLLDKIHVQYPNCKVMINGIHAGEVISPEGYGKRVFAFALNNAYKTLAQSSTYSSWVKFVHISSAFDARYGMQRTTKVKSMWTTETEDYVTDYVHPNDTNGYPMHAYQDVRAFFDMLNGNMN